MKRLYSTVIALIFSATLVACENSTSTADEPQSDSKTESKTTKATKLPTPELIEQIVGLAKDVSCESVSECSFIGIGARPCGGPDKYLIYSKVNIDQVKLTALVDDYNERKREYIKSQMQVGVCLVAPEPELECKEQRCQAVSKVRVGHSLGM
ncbi:hypothetical protein [Pleionea sediminis]|uniref:hypothetical protein n=1 Tax=Pleionea sediminis TaxID=2569479 RepID=UPI0011871A7F|nr:hypothetical protein [Pleionea sediminis]